MVSTEICPFEDPEYLTGIADLVAVQFEAKRKELNDRVIPMLTEEQRGIVIALDNLNIEEINAVQEATVKKVICEPCRRQGKPCRFHSS